MQDNSPILNADIVQFTYEEVQNCSSNLNSRIETCFGPHGIGACVINEIPNYSTMRKTLLPLAQRLATLPKDQLKELERPEAFHIKGWSCGAEQFKGVPDTSKGSFYNNPLYDVELRLSEEEIKEIGPGLALRAPNVWPTQIPELEGAFKNLGRLMIDVGAMLAYHIDKYVHSQNPNYEMGKLYRFVRSGDQHIGRLLHYYEGPGEQQWCGWHNDHSALTALTCPLYMKEDCEVNDFNDPETGLYTKNRFGEIVKLCINPNSMAFQIGETAQIVSGGIVEATPHYVSKGPLTIEKGYNRNTFALFMSPKFNERLNVPNGTDKEQALNKPAYNVPPLIGRWEENITFLNYSANTMKAYSTH